MRASRPSSRGRRPISGKVRGRPWTRGHRSRCPINLSLELLGDRWSLLVLRDMIFGGKRHFRDFMRCEEGIASNILADRLRRLVDARMLTKSADPTHQQKAIYGLTEKSISLVPVLAHLATWGRRWLDVSREMGARAEALEEGGPPLWERFMEQLRAEYMRSLVPGAPGGSLPVRSLLQAAADRAAGGRLRQRRRRERTT